MRDTFISTLTELASKDSDIILLTGDLGFGVLSHFSEQFPNQFINCGVAEQNMTGIACGLAMEGKKVYTYSIGNFNTLRPLEQIRNDICYHNANVTIVSVGAGFSYGQLGMSHFATEDISIMRSIPEMKVYCPCDKWEVSELTREIYKLPGPKYLRLDKGEAGTPEAEFKLGKIRKIKEGGDILLIGTGAIISELMRLSEMLETSGILSTVLSVHTIKPLDVDVLLDAIVCAKCIVTLEEHSVIGGLFSAVAEVCAENSVMPEFFFKFGINDFFPSIVGDQQYLREHCGLTAEYIFKKLSENRLLNNV